MSDPVRCWGSGRARRSGGSHLCAEPPSVAPAHLLYHLARSGDAYGQAAIRQHVPHLIEVEAEEAARFACNAVVIGRHVVLNTGCIVDHESMIGTAAHICPGVRIAGRVTVEPGAFIGIGATVLQCLRIGCEAVVGGGAVVIQDVEPMTTVVGVPARPLHLAPSYEQFAEIMTPPSLRGLVPAAPPVS